MFKTTTKSFRAFCSVKENSRNSISNTISTYVIKEKLFLALNFIIFLQKKQHYCLGIQLSSIKKGKSYFYEQMTQSLAH